MKQTTTTKNNRDFVANIKNNRFTSLFKLLLAIALFSMLLYSVAAAQPTLMWFKVSNVLNTSSQPLNNGDLTVNISTTETCNGNVYSKIFTGIIQNGKGAVLLGNATPTMSLDYNSDYYLCPIIQTEVGNIVKFRGGQGEINTEDVADNTVAKIDIATGAVGTDEILNNEILNEDIGSAAAIAFSKLASLPAANIIVGDATGVPTARAVTGDMSIDATGVTNIASGVITNADVSATAAIDPDKLASSVAGNILVHDGVNGPASVTMGGDATINSAGTVTISANAIGSSEVTDGTLTNDDTSSTAAIAFSKLASLLSGNIIVGSATSVPTSVAVTGDATLSNTGVLTINTDAVTSAKILNGAVSSSDLADSSVNTSHIVDGTITVRDFISDVGLGWTNLTNYPAACPAGQALVQIDDIPTCTAFSQLGGSIESAEITDGTIVNADVSATAAIDPDKLASSVAGNILVHDGVNGPASVTMGGDATINSAGTVTISTNAVGSAEVTDATLTNDDISSAAAIAHSKLASLPSTRIIIGDAAGVPTARTVTGDVTIDIMGVTNIASEVITNADISGSAYIAHSKLATLPSTQILVGSLTSVPTARTVSGDALLSNTGVLTIANSAVTSAKIFDGTIADADISSLANINTWKIMQNGTFGDKVVLSTLLDSLPGLFLNANQSDTMNGALNVTGELVVQGDITSFDSIGIGRQPNSSDYITLEDAAFYQSAKSFGMYSMVGYNGPSFQTGGVRSGVRYNGTHQNPTVYGVGGGAALDNNISGVAKVYGVWGAADDVNSIWDTGTYELYGVYGSIGYLNSHSAPIIGYGVYGAAKPAGGGSNFTYYAGYFDGDTKVTGNLTVDNNLKVGASVIVDSTGDLAMNNLEADHFDAVKGYLSLGCYNAAVNCNTVCSDHSLSCNTTYKVDGTSDVCGNACTTPRHCWCE